ncbi:diguanylate cyclase (GGDEF) domain-containing protein [Halanaerobium congolense]|uniref:Diguanylate cyclase (GGDEF) domain-containing protein n=1 Tax=Halanaerobium congolense TaxID=54121 RepID=A0A1I0D2S0_9FIRM|nr:diguanylate cyclase (GGDEF)-like protein [Halanaerobium congolense]SDG18243.1 diguanylate cyclase (GGDEF) domain-containing protein [Halanaerobium congolense]SET26386.1 diguanylate cyclase (GGDEF) domain-containing protein [Halanaerobium congolense]SFP76792.1 diguanylate cyclase (GGDEF) domain-containing protein [Halanaerobium congolense]
MGKSFKKASIYFILIIFCFYVLFNIIYFQLKIMNFYWYIMMSVTFILISIVYLKGIIFSLLSSLIIIFIYGSYSLYFSIHYNRSYQIYDYFWLIIIPLFAYLSGLFGDHIRQLSNSEEKLVELKEKIATRDEITNLHNEKEFYHNLEEEIHLAKRQEFDLSLMLIRLKFYDQLVAQNGQKKVNKIIRKISDLIPQAVRKEDKEYIIKDDTFAIILPFCDPQFSLKIKDRVKEKLGEIIIRDDGYEEVFNLDLQLALVSFDNDIKGPFELKERAEEALNYDVR